jgi:hypothetical protein
VTRFNGVPQAFEDTGRKVQIYASRQFQVSAYWSAAEDKKLVELVQVRCIIAALPCVLAARRDSRSALGRSERRCNRLVTEGSTAWHRAQL